MGVWAFGWVYVFGSVLTRRHGYVRKCGLAFCTLCICSFKGKNSCVLGESAVRTSLLGLARYCGFSPLARCVIDRHALCFG